MIGILTNHWSEFLSGFWNTILCSLIALFFSLILGVGFALLEVAPNKFGRAVAHVYIEIFRNIPLLVITMIFYLVVPQIWFKVSGFAAGTIGLTLYTSAFIAETVRANGRSSFKWDDLYASNAICYFATSSKDCNSSIGQSIY